MKEIKFTRADLHQLVWSYPLDILAQRYWLTYHNFKEVCLNRNIPIPKPIYWQNLELDNPVSVDPLPEFAKDNSDITLHLWEEGDESRPEHKLTLAFLEKRIQKDKKLSIFSKKLSSQNALIANARKLLESSHMGSRDNGLASSQRDGLDIKVAPKNIDRALRFMDTLMELLEERGHTITVQDEETHVIIQGEEIKICLREKTTKTNNKDSIWTEFLPTGILCFKIDAHPATEWIDRSETIEEKMHTIVYKLELKGIRLRERSLFWKKEREAREEVERKKQELAQRKENELSLFRQLLKKSERWKKSVLLKEYIDNVEANALSCNSMTDDLKNWLIWARNKANWYDPNINAIDELLADADKDTLTFVEQKYRYGL